MGIATRLGTENVLSFNMLEITDYGRPMKPFFIEQTFGLEQTNWADKFWGTWGIFGQTISTASNHYDRINQSKPKNPENHNLHRSGFVNLGLNFLAT